MAADGKILVDGNELDLPRVEATEGTEGLRIGSLLKETGTVTYDPGFTSTAASSSKITFIDGENGILRYRGYPIEELAEKSSFIEVCYLLIYGELPTAHQLADFTAKYSSHMIVNDNMREFFRAFPYDAHPMSMVSGAISAMSTFYQHSLSVFDDGQVELSMLRLLAKMPTITALASRRRSGVPVVHPSDRLTPMENFARVHFALPTQEDFEPDPLLVKALDVLFILHADHEQNCSTSTVRLVGSSQANIYQSVSAGVSALSGPLHGGANSAVLEMLHEISQSDDGAEKYMERVKNKEQGVRLMGFGHRVYKHYDPRAAIVKQVAHDVIEKLGGNDELLDLAMKLEEIALADDYFVSRHLYPNVDFYTGLIYKAMGFRTDMFTVLFAAGRLPGWIAQWHEMIQDPETKIGRPRQVYTGSPQRLYVPVGER